MNVGDALEHLVGGVGAFVFALVVVAVVRRFASRRIVGARVGVLLAALPLAALVWSAVRGLPAEVRGQALATASEHPGSFQVGLGMTPLGVIVRVVVTHVARGTRDARGVSGIVATALAKHVHPFAPAVLVGCLAAAALVALVRHARAVRASRLLVAAAEAGATSVTFVPAGGRTVKLIVSAAVEGTPFTGGFFAPHVVFPRSTWEALTEEERSAALAHEMAHVREGHILVASLVGLVCAAFVFVPFVRRAEARLRDALEAAADERAVADGACPYALASALVRVREHVHTTTRRSALALGACHGSLGARVDDLLEAPVPAPRSQVVAGLVAAALVALVVLRSLVLP